jgi:putative protein kinase ArgK-like GTPase of G3E family
VWTDLWSPAECGTTISAAQADQEADLANAKSRIEAARTVYEGMIEETKVNKDLPDAEKLYVWSRRWMEAQRDVSNRKQDQIAAIEAHAARMKGLAKLFKKLQESGHVGQVSTAAAEFYRLEAEKYLLDAKKK